MDPPKWCIPVWSHLIYHNQSAPTRFPQLGFTDVPFLLCKNSNYKKYLNKCWAKQCQTLEDNIEEWRPIKFWSNKGIFQPIKSYSSICVPIPAYFSPFQPIPTHSSQFQPLFHNFIDSKFHNFSISAFRYYSILAFQHFSLSIFQHTSISIYQHIRISVYQHISISDV